MTATVRQEWPSAWSAASSTTVASGAASSSCLIGSTITAWVLWSNNASTLPASVIDSASQTYTYSGTTVFNNNTGLNWALYYFKNNASATQLSITATWGAAQTFLGIWPGEITGVSTSAPYQTSGGNSQDNPGTGTGLITSTNVTPTSAPALLYAISIDSHGGASSVVAGSLSAGTTGLLLTGNTAPSGTSGTQQLAATTPIAGTFTNATDGSGASFLTLASVWTPSASGNTASIAWVV